MRKKTLALLASSLLFFQEASFPILAQDEIWMEEGELDSEYDANMEGFLNWILDQDTSSSAVKKDAQAALKVLHDDNLKEYTDLNDPNDATALSNIKSSIFILEECNRLRQLPEHKASPLKVSLELMAMSQKQLNWSDTNRNHAAVYFVGENLAWGYSNPFRGWYDEEKICYDRGEISKAGHYLNIINPSYKATGAAHNDYYRADGQVFFPSDKGTLSVTEFKQLFTQFEKLAPSTPAQNEDPVQNEDPAQNSDSTQNGDQVSLYRLYNRYTGEHFYTLSALEYSQYLATQDWNDEGIAWNTPSSSNYPIYRLKNPNNNDHHYTLDENEYLILQILGWVGEGIRFYSALPEDEGAMALYRLYNPNATDAGAHHYTVDTNERDALVKYGWIYEGVAWFGLK